MNDSPYFLFEISLNGDRIMLSGVKIQDGDADVELERTKLIEAWKEFKESKK